VAVNDIKPKAKAILKTLLQNITPGANPTTYKFTTTTPALF
jgi:hypothetical protein